MSTQKTIFIIFCFIFSSSSYASLARISTFGTQPVFQSNVGVLPNTVTSSVATGSLWMDDETNVFYNPAYINEYKNFVTLQKGLEFGSFISISENMVAGIYFNRGGMKNQSGLYTSGAQRMYAPGLVGPGIQEIQGPNDQNYYTGGTNGSSVETHVPVDLFIGGDYGAKYGLHFVTAHNPILSKSDIKTSHYWHTDFGFQIFGIEPFFGLTDASEVAYERKSGMGENQGVQVLNEFTAGFRFRYEGWSPYFVSKRFVEKGTPLNAAHENKTLMHTYGFGLGHDQEMIPNLHLIKHIGFFFHDVTETHPDVSSVVFPDAYNRYTQVTVPVNVAAEYKLSENLIIRAGGQYSLINYADIDKLKPGYGDAKANLRSFPEFRIGTTIQYAGYDVDVTAGNGNAIRNAFSSSSNTGFQSQVFMMLSLNYRWDKPIQN